MEWALIAHISVQQFASQSSHFVDKAGWHAEMDAITLRIVIIIQSSTLQRHLWQFPIKMTSFSARQHACLQQNTNWTSFFSLKMV